MRMAGAVGKGLEFVRVIPYSPRKFAVVVVVGG